ncbi:MAG: hypothetical protein PHN63_04645 [Candidatus Omnitrophica bacterium]|nr:hypothetical protein [Candidatus Omnitrophota bacterium]
MVTDVKYTHKTSYRINDRIKSIINCTVKDIRRETGIKPSMGRVSRAFWVSLASDPALRKKFINKIYGIILQEASDRNNKNRYVIGKKTSNKHGNAGRR